MYSKLVGVGLSAVLTLALAVPSLAFGFFPYHFNNQDSIKIENEKTSVDNLVVTKANTGENSISVNSLFKSAEVEHAGINTSAAEAGASLENQVNFNQVSTCGLCSFSGTKLSIENEKTSVDNTVITKANSGENSLSASSFLGGAEIEHAGISSGYAGSTSLVTNIVNSNIVGGLLTP